MESVFLFMVTVPVWVMVRLVLYFKNRKQGKFFLKREIMLNIFFIYILNVLSITFFPIYFHGNRGYFSVNFIPVLNTIKELISIGDSSILDVMLNFWISNIAGNMLLLLPLGFLVPILWKKFQDGHKMILLAFCFSLSIELLQLLLTYMGVFNRAFDVDDIILNTLGGCIGYFLYKKLMRERMVMK